MTLGPAKNRAEHQTPFDMRIEDYKSLVKQQEELLPWQLSFLNQGIRPPYFPQQRFYEMITNNTIAANRSVFNCGAAHSVTGVDVRGRLYPCTKFCGMSKYVIGQNGSGLDSKKCINLWLNYYKEIKKICGDCWAFPICKGPCIWECAQDNGQMRFDTRLCFYIKRQIEFATYLASKKENENVKEKSTQSQ